MQLLPKWALVSPFPSLYDFESLTATQQTARVYGAMNEMIREYNSFVDQINKEIENFTGSGEQEITNFKQSIEQRLICKFNDIDAKLAGIKTNIVSYTNDYLAKIPTQLPVATTADNGKIMMVSGGNWGLVNPAFTYDPLTETLTLNILKGE